MDKLAECGQGLQINRQPRIKNGIYSKEGAHPWAVYLKLSSGLVCCGSLIPGQEPGSSRYVLTASHCVGYEQYHRNNNNIQNSVFQ